MKKIIALVVCFMFMAGVALATADYFSTNKGGVYGKFTKTKKPEAGALKFYSVETRAATTEIVSGEAIMGVSVDGTGYYLYIIAEGPTNTYTYRTIRIGQLATYDAIALP
jgi:hypothetical protein